MDEKLQQKLYDDFPKIFRQHTLPMSETCMCWGVDCSDGWEWLIRNLCSQLQWDIDNNGYPQLEASQIKEKFGTLRFYADHSNEKQQAMISFAESLSAGICETCGTTKNVKTNGKGWVRTLCENCRKEEK
jgi:hypothetical protein